MKAQLKFYKIKDSKTMGMEVVFDSTYKNPVYFSAHPFDGIRELDQKPEQNMGSNFESTLNAEVDPENLYTSCTDVEKWVSWKYYSLFVSPDVCQFNPELNAGIYHTIGYREEQEDEDCMGLLPDWDKLNEQYQKIALENTVRVLQQKYMEALNSKSILYDVGSTFISTIINKNELTTVYAGDSVSYFVILDQEGKCVRTERLNKNLHNPDPDNHEEWARLVRLNLPAGMMPWQDKSLWRLACGHAISRSLGDEIARNCGMISVPEIDHTTFEIPKGGKAFVVVACDGLTEEGCLDQNSIAEIIAKNTDKSPEQIAKLLAEEAIKKGSKDNVSVLIMPLTGQDNSKYLTVFDGHGGGQVSKMMSKLYHEVLCTEIQKALALQNAEAEKPKKKIIEFPQTEKQGESRYIMYSKPNINPAEVLSEIPANETTLLSIHYTNKHYTN